jgi:hypothetical protein
MFNKIKNSTFIISQFFTKINFYKRIKIKLMKNNILSATILTIAFIVAPLFINTVIGQPPPPDPVDIPLDGGLFALLIVGLFYGGRKIYKEEKQKKANQE